MLGLIGGVAGALVLALPHHLTGADVGTMPIWRLAGLWHVLSTVVVPAIIVAAAFLSTIASASPWDRPWVLAAEREPTPVLAYAPPDHPSGSGSADEERRSNERAAARPVERFYRVTFADERGFRLWTERVVEFTAILQDVFPDLRDVRPVIFVELKPARDATPHAYVSAGVRGLAANISGGAKVDPTPVSAAELPAGLTMLYGEGVDAADYERRHA